MARKEKTYHFIYKTTNKLSGRYYIGMHSTNNLDDGYMGSGNRLRLAIRKHGKQNFIREIIEFCSSREELRKREAEIITLEEIAKEECMNLTVGGEGGLATSELTSKLQKEKWKDPVYFDKIRTVLMNNTKKYHESGRHKYNTFDGKTHSTKTKKLMSEKAKERVGNKNSQYGTCWITKDGVNKKIKKEDLELNLNNGWVKGRK